MIIGLESAFSRLLRDSQNSFFFSAYPRMRERRPAARARQKPTNTVQFGALTCAHVRKYEISGEIPARVWSAVRPAVRRSETHAAGHPPAIHRDRAVLVRARTNTWPRSCDRRSRARPLPGSTPSGASTYVVATLPSWSSDETTEKNVVRITQSTGRNQKQQRASGRGCPNTRWRCFAARRGLSVVDVTRR